MLAWTITIVRYPASQQVSCGSTTTPSECILPAAGVKINAVGRYQETK